MFISHNLICEGKYFDKNRKSMLSTSLIHTQLEISTQSCYRADDIKRRHHHHHKPRQHRLLHATATLAIASTNIITFNINIFLHTQYSIMNTQLKNENTKY